MAKIPWPMFRGSRFEFNVPVQTKHGCTMTLIHPLPGNSGYQFTFEHMGVKIHTTLDESKLLTSTTADAAATVFKQFVQESFTLLDQAIERIAESVVDDEGGEGDDSDGETPDGEDEEPDGVPPVTAKDAFESAFKALYEPNHFMKWLKHKGEKSADTLSLSEMQRAMKRATVGAAKPNAIIMNSEVYNKKMRQLEAIQREAWKERRYYR